MVGLMAGLRTDSVSGNIDLVRANDIGGPQPRTAPPGNIADPYADLLSFLDEPQRKGMIALLAVGYYDGWRPSREELADLVSSRTTDQARQRLLQHQLRQATAPSSGKPDGLGCRPRHTSILDRSSPVSS